MKTFYPACVACAAVTLLAAGCMSSMPPGTTVFHVMYQQEQGTETLGVPNSLTSIGLLA